MARIRSRSCEAWSKPAPEEAPLLHQRGPDTAKYAPVVHQQGFAAGDLEPQNWRMRSHQGVAAGELPIEGLLPSFDGATRWLNSQRLTPDSLRGRVVVVQFWTYTCINWLRTQAYFRAWSQRYRDLGLVTIGVHTPEFAFEHVPSNVRQAVKSDGIHYPVAIDDAYGTWQAYSNEYWPADYLIDKSGHVRSVHFGEGDYTGMEHDIQQLLGERTSTLVASHVKAIAPSDDVETPETYLGFQRGVYVQKVVHDKLRAYHETSTPIPNQVTLNGSWNVQTQFITSGKGASLRLQYTARRAYLVLGKADGAAPRSVRISVDGAKARTVKVDHDGLYNVATILGPSRPRTLVAQLPPGVRAYSFTFG
jgi:Thioredoxin like C-terminal domain/AhpC/TSA family